MLGRNKKFLFWREEGMCVCLFVEPGIDIQGVEVRCGVKGFVNGRD